jgi:type IV secretion system protein VirD4
MKMPDNRFLRYLSSKSDSRWADADEIKNSPTIARINIEAGDCQAGGIPVISDGRTAYVDDSDTHTLIFGSTGSKKTRLFGMPLINIFALAGESFIVTDPKGELYNKTSGLVAAKGYKTVVLNFRDFSLSDYWNPLALLYGYYHNGKTDEAIALMNDFISSLAEPQRKGNGDPYWIEMGSSLALAHLLFFIETATPEEANIFNYASFCATMSSPNGVGDISGCIAAGSIASVNYKGILTVKDAKSTFGSINSILSSMINPFVIRKSLCQVLSRSSFDIAEAGCRKTAIYIIIPDEKTTLHFLVTAFIKQTYEALIDTAQQLPGNRLPVRLNFVMDEFCNIPAIPDMASMISAARSRNMRFFLIAQSLWQLKHKYGEDADTIKGNCDNWVFLTSREYDLLKEISDLCGEIYYTDSDGSTELHPLISVSELQRFKKEHGETLLLLGRNYPFVTELPDIDGYKFPSYPTIVREKRGLPQIVRYDPDAVISEIKAKKRPLPFSVEMSGKTAWYEKSGNDKKK